MVGVMNHQISKWLTMAEVTAKKTIIKDVEAKVIAGRCLICGEVADGPRGLCTSHYLKFNRTINELPKSKRAEFEEEQIREGRILPVGQIAEIKKPNPFQVSS